MHRKKFLSLIEDYSKSQNISSEDFNTAQNLIKYVEANEDCFFRTKSDGAIHIASSVLLLNDNLQKALFLRHAKIQRWTQPGGHSDGNPDIHEVALKELEEETGIKTGSFIMDLPIYIHRFDYPASVYGYEKSIYCLFFAVKLPEGQTPQIKEPTKCEKMSWFSPKEITEILRNEPDEGASELINKWKNLLSIKEA